MTEDTAFEKALAFGAQFDFISPLCTIIRDIYHGPVERFMFHITDMYDVEDAMKQRRVFVWGWHMHEKPWMMIHCKRNAAGLVALTLRREGIVHTTTWDGRGSKRGKRRRR